MGGEEEEEEELKTGKLETVRMANDFEEIPAPPLLSSTPPKEEEGKEEGQRDEDTAPDYASPLPPSSEPGMGEAVDGDVQKKLQFTTQDSDTLVEENRTLKKRVSELEEDNSRLKAELEEAREIISRHN